MTAFIRIIEAPLDELFLIQEEVKGDFLLSTYGEILQAYLRSDISALLRLEEKVENHPLLKVLLKLRLGIREKRVSADLFLLAEDLIPLHPEWKGEIYFVCGFASEIRGSFLQAKDYYHSSYMELSRIGAHQKSLKALHNYISASTKAVPERAYFAEFSLIYRKAKALGNWEVSGTALTNVAREFQKIKAYSSALRYANRAMTLLSRAPGTHHQQLALLNRCHILCEMKRFREAMIDFESLRNSAHPEVKAGVLALEKVITQVNTVVDETALHPTWLERLAHKDNSNLDALTDHEERVVCLISCRPRTKFELIEDLYGEKIDIEAAENRLKNLLNRLRKKRPGLFQLLEGRYHIVDGEALEVG
jgi:tetratricopeptide (TPR) repeat protein